MNKEISEAAIAAFRAQLPDLKTPRFASMKEQDCHVYAEQFLTTKHPPWLYALYEHWRSLFDEPYKGVTNDGTQLLCINPVEVG